MWNIVISSISKKKRIFMQKAHTEDISGGWCFCSNSFFIPVERYRLSMRLMHISVEYSACIQFKTFNALKKKNSQTDVLNSSFFSFTPWKTISRDK